jgi:hypothetical protein
MALGFTALYAAWISSGIDQTLRLYNQLEHILTARNTLVERPWDDGAEVTVISLIELSPLESLTTLMFLGSCKNTPGSCGDEEIQREHFFGLTLKEMQQKLPRARRFELTGVRSEYGGSCSAIFFQGKDEEAFLIKGIFPTFIDYRVQRSPTDFPPPGVTQVRGSLIYYVQTSTECRFSPGLLSAPSAVRLG